MQGQGALADPALAGADGDEMAHPGEPVGDAGALLGNLLEDSGASVAGDVVVALHLFDVAYTVAQRPRRAMSTAFRRELRRAPYPDEPSLDLASFTMPTSTARSSSGVVTGLAKATRTGRGPSGVFADMSKP